MDGWDLRYYGNQRLTFELFSTYGNGGWMTLQADVTGLRFFEDWQRIYNLEILKQTKKKQTNKQK